MNEQELNQKFAEYENKIRQLQEQLRAVDQAIYDMKVISSGVEDLKGKEDEEILAPIGRGIYVKTKLLSEKLTVDVGSHNFVEKTIDETKDLIKVQREKLENVRTDLESKLKAIDSEITQTMKEFQSKQKDNQ